MMDELSGMGIPNDSKKVLQEDVREDDDHQLRGFEHEDEDDDEQCHTSHVSCEPSRPAWRRLRLFRGSWAKSAKVNSSLLRAKTSNNKKPTTLSILNAEHTTSLSSVASSAVPPASSSSSSLSRSSALKRMTASTMSLGRHRQHLLTVEELYVEVLYTVLHMLGCDADRDEQKTLIQHLQQAFHMDEERHERLLDIATMREEPYLKACVEVLEARNLVGKDVSGVSSNPYCTLHMTTNPLATLNTSCKWRTLEPKWNEQFILDVNSIDQDGLRVDVWSFSPEENVGEKLKRIHEVKDGRGLRRFIKETLRHASNGGKTDHKFIGSAQIALQSVPVSGLSGWVSLEKESRSKRGELRVSVTLSREKDASIGSQEHRHLLKILFDHELFDKQVGPYEWQGSLSRCSVSILAQHAVQGKLSGADTALARWLVYTRTHLSLPLNYTVFPQILLKLQVALNQDLLSTDDEASFIEAAEGFVRHCCTHFLAKHRQLIANDTNHALQLDAILKSLGCLAACLENRDVSALESTIYAPDPLPPHIATMTSLGNISRIVDEAVNTNYREWLKLLLESHKDELEKECNKIRESILVSKLLLSDLQQAVLAINEMFVGEQVSTAYIVLALNVYCAEIKERCEDLVVSSSSCLRSILYTEQESNDAEVIERGTELFELYIVLKQLIVFINEHVQSSELMAATTKDVTECHVWFTRTVARWLDIALYKAMQRIVKAVELDELQPVDELVDHSSSAVDFRTVLMQIKTFWIQLDWPDVEGAYAFISKILDDVCATSTFYADQMCKRVCLGSSCGWSLITSEVCLAINNMDFVLAFIEPFVSELGVDNTLDALEHLNGSAVASSCRKTLNTLVANAVEDVENKLAQQLELIGTQMAPIIEKFLDEGSNQVCHSHSDPCAQLSRLDSQLVILRDRLSSRNFQRLLDAIWESSAQNLNHLLRSSVERQRSPLFFRALLDVLDVLVNFLDQKHDNQIVHGLRRLLKLYAADSDELIARYVADRHQAQNNGNNELGCVTIRCQRSDTHLRVEVLNARHLRPPKQAPSLLKPGSSHGQLWSSRLSELSKSRWFKSKFASFKSGLQNVGVLHSSDSAGVVNPYVSVRIVPNGVANGKRWTRVQRQTLFPLFDETFDFVLSPDWSVATGGDAYLVLSVKHRGRLGSRFLGEAFVPLADIDEKNLLELRNQPQLHLTLTRPERLETSEVSVALAARNLDPVAKAFLAKERAKT